MLSESQVKQLADHMVTMGGNVYDEAEDLFGERPGDEVFSQLVKAGVSKCVECNRWLPVSDFYEPYGGQFPDACVECLDGDGFDG